jgi:hypothetical protein
MHFCRCFLVSPTNQRTRLVLHTNPGIASLDQSEQRPPTRQPMSASSVGIPNGFSGARQWGANVLSDFEQICSNGYKLHAADLVYIKL